MIYRFGLTAKLDLLNLNDPNLKLIHWLKLTGGFYLRYQDEELIMYFRRTSWLNVDQVLNLMKVLDD